MKTTFPTIAALALTGVLLVPALAFAQTATVTTTTNSTATSVTAKMKTAISRADKEITRRIAVLNDLNLRVGQMQKVTDAFKQSLTTTVQGQISALTALQAKIDADTDAATLKMDVQSVTQSYRIFALIVPQGSIAAAADRVVTMTNMMTTLGSKLQTRLAAAQSSGTDVTTLSTALSDLGAKLSDASIQAQQSVSVSATLVPDQGDKTKMAANTAALKSARADLSTAQKDLAAGRKDITTILKGLKVDPSATSTTTTTP
jgi:hypothetical protein